ncbi:MAG: type III-B CRISPR-associated protein Cas10/Cmr2, partial [Chloroflexota bacterium]
MPYLLSFSIGPVQDFIAAARKTRDLWFGSELLSEIARGTAQALKESGAELIFPAADSLEGKAPIPNKILAIVSDPATLTKEAKRAACTVLRTHADRAWAVLQERRLTDYVDAKLFSHQTADFLEFYAAWYPYDPADPKGYKDARAGVEKLLAGRKALRDFAPASGKAGVPKSLLDGGRESVIDLKGAGPEIANRLNLRKGELLDGISLIKRLGEAKRFVSVSRIAYDPLIHRLPGPTLKELVGMAAELDRLRSPFVQSFPSRAFAQYQVFPFDTELCFGEPDKKEDTDNDRLDLAKELAGKFLTACKALDVSEPLPYLAVLVADGDRVGKALNEMYTPEEHRAFSKLGVRFAREAEEVVGKHHGALVYSGGDDVLAFLPLHHALACAKALREKFVGIMAELKAEARPTLSVGLSIGHFNTPLDLLLDWGRKAEHAAKRDRNALAVALHTRSAGEESVTVTASWDHNPIDRRQKWIDALREERLPSGTAYELRGLAREFRRLLQADKEQTDLIDTLLEPEMRRILIRKRGGGGSRKLTSEEINDFVDHVISGAGDQEARLVRLEGLVNELIIA